MNIQEKLNKVQTMLVVPKNQYNKFGNYKYRSLEDITEGVRPLLKELGLTLVMSDEIVQVGERYYIKAICTITDTETGESITNTAYARESENKKGMDSSQVTGATSSYARKYALNGLFAIDDNKDADTEEFTNTSKNKANSSKKTNNNTSKSNNKALIEKLIKVAELKGYEGEKLQKIIKAKTKKDTFSKLTQEELKTLIIGFEKLETKGGK